MQPVGLGLCGFVLAGVVQRSCIVAILLVMRGNRNGRILLSVCLVFVLLRVVKNVKGFSHLMRGVIRSACH